MSNTVYKPGDFVSVKAFISRNNGLLYPVSRNGKWDGKTLLKTQLLAYDFNENTSESRVITREVIVEVQWPNDGSNINDAMDFDGWFIDENTCSYLSSYIGKYACWSLYSNIIGYAGNLKMDGEFCMHCKAFSHMSAPNRPDGFLCYGCRSTYGWMYR